MLKRKEFSHQKCGLNKFQVCLYTLHPPFLRRRLQISYTSAAHVSSLGKFLKVIHQEIIYPQSIVV